MRPPCYDLLEGIVILGVTFGSLVLMVCNPAAPAGPRGIPGLSPGNHATSAFPSIHRKAFEYLWEGGNTLTPERARILTHVLRWNYGDMLSSSCYGNCPPSRHPKVDFEFDKQKLHNESDVKAHAKALVYVHT